MQRDFSTLDRTNKPAIAEPHFGKGRKGSGNDDIDIPGGSFEADLDIIGPQYQPPVARAVTGLRYAAKIETNDETLRRYLRRIDLPPDSPNKHSWIEIIGTDQPLSPTLAP